MVSAWASETTAGISMQQSAQLVVKMHALNDGAEVTGTRQQHSKAVTAN